MDKGIKDSFGKHLLKSKETIQLDHAGPTGPPYNNVLGQKWHRLMKKSVERELEKISSDDSDEEDAGISLIGKLHDGMKIRIISSDFHLYGYMYNKKELSPVTYFWQGDADAITMFRQGREIKYAIVDWKVKKDLLEFWTSSETFGMYLHQGLLYAKLLQLHLDLNYLPSVLLVPISGESGRDIHPGLFFDYPKECKEWIDNQFWWGTKPPEPIRQIYAEESLLKHDVLEILKNGKFDRSSSTFSVEKHLKDVFDKNATVGDLLKALGSDARSLTIIPREKSEDNWSDNAKKHLPPSTIFLWHHQIQRYEGFQ